MSLQNIIAAASNGERAPEVSGTTGEAWHQIAERLRPRFRRIAALMDECEPDIHILVERSAGRCPVPRLIRATRRLRTELKYAASAFAQQHTTESNAPDEIRATIEPLHAARGGDGDCNSLHARGRTRHFGRDGEIYCDGEAAEHFFLVISGVVRTCKFLADGRRQVEAFHGAGDIFGLELGATYNLSAAAVCKCTVKSYPRRFLETLAAHDMDLTQQLFSHAMRNLTRARDHSISLGRRTAIEKVALFLNECSGYSPDPGRIDLVMKREDIADYLGLTVETISRALAQLEHDAFIVLSGSRRVQIRDASGLRQFAS
jgi:CRP/FNR family transcriptional regulator, nitrogen fixation regulation protein